MDEEEAEKSLFVTTETKMTNVKEGDAQEWRISLLQYASNILTADLGAKCECCSMSVGIFSFVSRSV